MSLILSIDTSTDVCSAALHRDGVLVHSRESHLPQAHGSQLAVLINDLFDVSNESRSELGAVAVSSGPGSYTGLRIGVSTAKGICVGLDIPLIAIETLTLMAFQARKYCESDDYLCPMLDARRMEVYCLVTNCQLETIYPVEAKVIDEKSFEDDLKKRKIIFFGNGAAKCKASLIHYNASFIDGIYPQAEKLGELAYPYLKENKFADLITFEPFYLKEFVAKKAKSLL